MSNTSTTTSGIYVHIPFCDHKCIYCDFYSIIKDDNAENYLRALQKEIIYYARNYANSHVFDSIFFGGGTPSYMSAEYITEILTALKSNFVILPDAEITLETNPGTVNRNKLEQFRNAGINRISIGIQSFDENDLRFLTRIHDSATAKQTVTASVEAGFQNLSIDLIFNLPGQTKEAWRNNLIQATELPIQHISAYSLILEKGTILNKMVLDGKVKIQDDDHDAELYETTMEFLERSGFIQYEVSNFARDGFQCRHNNHYWQYDNYLSFGTSSHSFMNNKRWWNISSLTLYRLAMNERGQAVASEEILDENQQLTEYTMLLLRGSGLNLSELERRFGDKWYEANKVYISDFISRGYIIRDEQTIKLSRKGYAVCDEILRNFI